MGKALKKGREVVIDECGQIYTIIREIARGAQGIVYHVQDESGNDRALKWLLHFDEKKRKSLLAVKKLGVDENSFFQERSEKYGIRFTFPLSMVYRKADALTGEGLSTEGCGGYIMPLWPLDQCLTFEQVRYTGGEWDFEELCRLSEQICMTFHSFHYKGYCYKDINQGNILFDLENKLLYLIDPDNIAQSSPAGASDVKGSPGFIAPEVMRDETQPNIHTDEFAVSILLFYIWVKDHPYDGPGAGPDLDQYMKKPVFIFHPTDRTNSVDEEMDPDGNYYWVRTWWDHIPKRLQRQFTRAFVDGIVEDDRISAGDWILFFRRMKKNGLQPCPGCGKMIARSARACIFCGGKKRRRVDREEITLRENRDQDQQDWEALAEGVKIRRQFEKSLILALRVIDRYKPHSFEDEVSEVNFYTDTERVLPGIMVSERFANVPELIGFVKDPSSEMMFVANKTEYICMHVFLKHGKNRFLKPQERLPLHEIREIDPGRGIRLIFEEIWTDGAVEAVE